MAHVYDQDGNLIATIHDEKAFSDLLDVFEKHTRLYGYTRPPLNAMAVFVNQGMLNQIIDAAKQLQEIRRRFGDPRDNLYPVEMPKQL